MSITIEIPDDLYAALQRLAVPFVDRAPADVIWRLVRGETSPAPPPEAARRGQLATRRMAPAATPRERARATGGAPQPATDVQATRPASGGLLASGVTIPNGLRLRFNYKGKILPGRVRDDRIWVAEQPYVSPSAAAAAAAVALGTSGGALNGWYYWEYEDPNAPGEWRRLETLRKEGERRRRKRRS